MILDIIILFTVPFLIGCVFSGLLFLKIYRQHKAAWQDEYRRLMAGIDGAMIILRRFRTKNYAPAVENSLDLLSKTYNGEK